MKKLLFILATGSIAFSANAQLSRQSNATTSNKKVAPARTVGGKTITPAAIPHAAKTTAATSRWYDYSGYFENSLGTSNVDVTALILWNDTMAQINYTSGLAHNNMVSSGTVFHPQFSGFNDESVYAGEMEITAANAYTVDSLQLVGIYGFNPAKTAVVDTLIFTLVNGTGMGTSDVYRGGFIDAGTLSDYDLAPDDTLFFKNIGYDSVTNTATGTTAYTFKYPLTSASWADTNTNGVYVKTIAIPTAYNVPAGNILGLSLTFKSGDAAFVPHDTVLTNHTPGFNRYNNFRPLVIYKNSGTTPQFAPYSATDYNEGLYKTLPNSDNGWGGDYVPMWAWSTSTGASSLQHLSIGIHAKCTNCGTVSVANTVKNISNVASYPNPAKSVVNVEFNLATAASATVTLTNSVGQVVATQKVAKANQGVATFNTASLASGIYIYTIVANGERTSGRISVAH